MNKFKQKLLSNPELCFVEYNNKRYIMPLFIALDLNKDNIHNNLPQLKIFNIYSDLFLNLK